MEGLVADIKRASFHDGPGFRTVIFFKGCPLSCAWCHNPECISFKKEELFYPDKCIGCGRCKEGCFARARVICGEMYTAERLFEEIAVDKNYYAEDGGVTFSGGEPLAQREFLCEIIDLCNDAKIKSAVETSLIYYDETIFKKLDLVMADLKIWDSDIHKKYTGVSNEVIKENFNKLNTLGIPIIARTPVIAEIEQGIDKISEYLYSFENVVKYELLPYHPLANSKLEALGLNKQSFKVPTSEYMKELSKYTFTK